MKTKLIITLLAIFASFTAMAQNKQTFTLSKDGKITVYFPEKPCGTVLMACPGGGYDHLAVAHEGHDMAPWLTSEGITYAVLEYTLPKQPLDTLPILDSHAALSFLAQNAASWGADPAKIGIMGSSAGGHLAAYTANTDSLVAFQVLLYPVISMEPGVTHAGTRRNLIGQDADSATQAHFTPSMRVHPGSPKAFIALSSDDRAVIPANSLGYAQALTKAGIPVELHMYPTGGHGWGYKSTFKYHDDWTKALTAWLRAL